MGLEPELQSALLSAVPEMRAFALRLCRRADRADDLVQDTLLRAIANINTFRPGTNMAAWLFTILRHSFLNDCRRIHREAPDADVVDSLTAQPDQEAHIQLGELLAALAQLSADQREAVLLVGAGIPYSEAAHMCHCEVGTIKSRSVAPARVLPSSWRSRLPRISGRIEPSMRR
jgi:RNA polymerase sigma-70 factor (ECF subfamily)